MSEPQSTADLRILAEMAEEIDERGMTALPGSLRSFVKTARGKAVAATLERLALELLDSRAAKRAEKMRADREISGLRNTIQELTDAALAKEQRR